jgi:cell division protein FtsN
MKLLMPGALIFLGLAGSSRIALAQPPVLHRLSPPPAVGEVSDRTPSPQETPQKSSKSEEIVIGREFTFRAPQTPPTEAQNNTPLPSYTSDAEKLFRVEVLGRSEAMLARVRAIEPTAFIRRGETVIQVGLFRGRSQAEQRLQQLESQGLSARVVSVK